jgi:23S rRNA (adenine-N6)-dimethyltransferase
LRDPRLIERLVQGSQVTVNDTVLDIGAGSGSIARVLAEQSQHVIAYEADARLAEQLRSRFSGVSNVDVMAGDFLTFDLPTTPYKVFSNIPFNRTSDIVRKLLDADIPPTDSYLIMQQDAAIKFTGEPGRGSLFSVLHQPFIAMNIVHRFRPTDFTPRPSVNVVMVHCHVRIHPLIPRYRQLAYTDFVSYIFNHANPNIFPALKVLFPGTAFNHLQAIFDPNLTAKPSRLSLEDWLLIFDLFQKMAGRREDQLISGTGAKLKIEATHIEKHHRTRLVKNWREGSTD